MMMHRERKAIAKLNLKLLKSNLCDYSDVYILVKGTISIAPQAEDNSNNKNKEVPIRYATL